MNILKDRAIWIAITLLSLSGFYYWTVVDQSRVDEMIDLEDKTNPIRDEELTQKLNVEGYKIARRTVTKYREQIKYPTARLRRQL